MFYSVRHVTRFRYSGPVRESVMELRMQPRSEGPQTLRSFQISTNPRAQLYAYTDHLGNAVYHFKLLREHEELRIEAQARCWRRATEWRSAQEDQFSLCRFEPGLLKRGTAGAPLPRVATVATASAMFPGITRRRRGESGASRGVWR